MDINWEQVWSIASLIILIAYQITILVTIVFIILDNKKPEKTIAWVVVLVILPVVGLLAYLNFGRNLRKIRLMDRKSLMDDQRVINLANFQLEQLVDNEFGLDKKILDKKHIITYLLKSSKAILTEHNRVKIFTNGKENFESILNDLNNAKDHIHLEYYIFDADKIGNKIKDILVDKAKAGLEVRVIYDDVGSWGLKKRFLKDLKDAGVMVHSFLPVKFPLFTSKVNYRNHRKIIVIDGKIGYVGGMNIADRYIEGDKLGPWRDTHLRLDGNAVKALQLIFGVDWDFVCQKTFDTLERYFPPKTYQEGELVQIAASGPDSELSYIMETYFTAIATARKNIYIITPYLIPTESILTALRTASIGGVDVRIIIPKKSDSYWVNFSSLSYVEKLLKHGIRVYMYNKGFNHSKVMTVDGVFSSVGTANMDYRSFDYNLEVNAIIYDQKIASELDVQFFKDLENSEEIDLVRWKKRSLGVKIKHSFARVLAPIF